MLVNIKKFFKLDLLFLSISFFILSYYKSSFVFSILGENYKISLAIITLSIFLFNFFTNPEVIKKIIHSRYIFLLLYLLINYFINNSSFALRELIIGSSLLTIIYSPDNKLKEIIKNLIIINLSLLFLTSVIEIFIKFGLIDINNWELKNLSWIKDNSPLGARMNKLIYFESEEFKNLMEVLRPGIVLQKSRCFYNPYFISIIDYIAKDCSPNNFLTAYRVSFFWLEPTSVLISCSFICLATEVNLIKNFKYNVFLIFLLNSFSLTISSLLVFINLVILKIYTFLKKVLNKKNLIIFFSLTIVFFLINFYFLIINFIPSKIESFNLILISLKNTLSDATLFGSNKPIRGTDFGIFKRFYQYGAIGYSIFVFCYLPLYINAIKKIVNAKSPNQFLLHSSVILSSFLLLRSSDIINPSLIIIDQFTKISASSKEKNN